MDQNRTAIKIQHAMKRALDIFVALGALIFLWPVFIIIAAAIKIDSSGPVLYKHQRIGKNGKPFNLYKFRSMVYGSDDLNYIQYLNQLIDSEKDGSGKALPYRKLKDDQRVTRVGRILRTYYLDELPQVLNILVGDMSLVGPRPHVKLEVERYSPEQRQRLIAFPGMTGLWQVTGKADCTFSELISLDLKYIHEWSIWLDIQILFMTLWLMLHGGEGSWAVAGNRLSVPGELNRERREGINPHTRPRNTLLNSEGSDMISPSTTDDLIIRP